MTIEFKFQCKVCGKKYTISDKDIYKVPLWQIENCSKECSKVCSSKKFVNIDDCLFVSRHLDSNEVNNSSSVS